MMGRLRCCLLAGLAVVSPLPDAPRPPTPSPYVPDAASFQKLFLAAGDLPKHKLLRDLRRPRTDPEEQRFASPAGVYYGEMLWERDTDPEEIRAETLAAVTAVGIMDPRGGSRLTLAMTALAIVPRPPA